MQKLGESWASMRARRCLLDGAAGADWSFFGLQLTQPSSVLQRCIFVDLLQVCNVVTLAVTSLYRWVGKRQACSCLLVCYMPLAARAARPRPSLWDAQGTGVARAVFSITGQPYCPIPAAAARVRCSESCYWIQNPQRSYDGGER